MGGLHENEGYPPVCPVCERPAAECEDAATDDCCDYVTHGGIQIARLKAECARLRKALEKIIAVIAKTTNSHDKKAYNPYAGCQCAQGYAEVALRPAESGKGEG
jgi:hypothetical protein